jgi:hypothetical protein
MCRSATHLCKTIFIPWLFLPSEIEIKYSPVDSAGFIDNTFYFEDWQMRERVKQMKEKRTLYYGKHKRKLALNGASTVPVTCNRPLTFKSCQEVPVCIHFL